MNRVSTRLLCDALRDSESAVLSDDALANFVIYRPVFAFLTILSLVFPSLLFSGLVITLQCLFQTWFSRETREAQPELPMISIVRDLRRSGRLDSVHTICHTCAGGKRSCEPEGLQGHNKCAELNQEINGEREVGKGGTQTQLRGFLPSQDLVS